MLAGSMRDEIRYQPLDAVRLFIPPVGRTSQAKSTICSDTSSYKDPKTLHHKTPFSAQGFTYKPQISAANGRIDGSNRHNKPRTETD